jgi:hypothetical protein
MGADSFYSCVLNELLQLQKVLEPQGAVHKHRDLPTLKARVKEAEMLIRGLPCAHELHEDLYLAVKGIVTEASETRKRRQKPVLCVDDDDYIG